MKIAEIKRFPISFKPINSDIQTQRKSSKISDIETVIIQITTDGDVVGFGEVSIASASNQGIGGLLDRLEIYAHALVGVDARNLAVISQRLDRVETERSLANQPARAAFDMAIYDIIGKVRGVPVYEVLGGAYRTRMEMSATLCEATPEQNAADALGFVEQGFRGLKVNIGNNNDSNGRITDSYEQAKQKLRAVLEAVGSEISVDACANQSWTNAGQVRSIFTSLLEEKYYSNLSLEQPLHQSNLNGHAELCRSLPIPVVLGDCVNSPQAMVQISRLAAADRIVLNINNVGGIGSACQIANICEASAIGVSVHSKRGSKLADTAHCHLAATIRDPMPLSANGRVGFDDSLFSGGFNVIEGHVVLGDEPGLGVDINEDSLIAHSLEF